jgi:hypothetical protein
MWSVGDLTHYRCLRNETRALRDLYDFVETFQWLMELREICLKHDDRRALPFDPKRFVYEAVDPKWVKARRRHECEVDALLKEDV